MADEEFKSMTARLPIALSNRLDSAVERANELGLGVSKSQWVVAALEAALDEDEKKPEHVPQAILDARPIRRGAKMQMPKGRVMTGRTM